MRTAAASTRQATPELGWHQQSRFEAIRANLDLWSRPIVSVLSREKLDETVGNFSCLVEWSALTALGSRCPMRQ
jgi:hypothetical protein